GLAKYARYQSAGWRGLLLGTIVVVDLAYLVPDLLLRRVQVAGFSQFNANYFATFLLIGLAATLAVAAFATRSALRVSAAAAAALILFGIVKTSSRGATLAVIAMGCVAAVRARGRIPRQALLGTALAMLIVAIISSPYLVQKFLDRGEVDPYNYARTEI